LNNNTNKENKQKSIDDYDVTCLQTPRLKDVNNYDVSDLASGDETDDEDEPSKPVPDWAKEPELSKKAIEQAMNCINYTKMFRETSKAEINLEDIFKFKRRKFTERSSSANWTTPPVWSTDGLTGDESFRYFKQKS
jgi:hypothetical protein